MIDFIKEENMFNKIKISIIIPAYNAEDSLMKCINSILLQTYNNLQIIVIDDGSTVHLIYQRVWLSKIIV